MSSYALPIPGLADSAYATRAGNEDGFGEPNTKNCAPLDDEGNPAFDALCAQTTGFSNSYGWSFAELAAEVKANALAAGQPAPDYCAFRVYLHFGSMFPAYYGCKSIDQDEANGWCGDHEWGATNSGLTVSGGTGEWVAQYDHDYGPVDTSVVGIGPPSLGADAPGGTWQQGIWWAVEFSGWVVNPDPPGEISIPSVAGPFTPSSYGGSLLFPIDEPPPDLSVIHNVSGTNFPPFSYSITAQGYYEYPPTAPPPPVLGCTHNYWAWATPIDFFEDWDLSSADGRSDISQILELPSGVIQEDDLLIVTMMMYMPSGDTPYLTLGRWPYPAPAFIDETSEWTAFPGYRAHDIYVRSWWRRANADTIANNGVTVNVYNFDAPLDPEGNSSEGGVIFLNAFRGVVNPTLAYQQSNASALVHTPYPAADASYVLNHFFAKRENSRTESIHGVVARISSYSDGLEGFPGGGGGGAHYVPWMTTVLLDRRTHMPDTGYFEDLDLYAVGFYAAPGFGISGYDGHAERVLWDMSTPGPYENPFGPVGSVQQGIKIICGGDENCQICFV